MTVTNNAEEKLRGDVAHIMRLAKIAREEARCVGFNDVAAIDLACSFVTGYTTGLLLRPRHRIENEPPAQFPN